MCCLASCHAADVSISTNFNFSLFSGGSWVSSHKCHRSWFTSGIAIGGIRKTVHVFLWNYDHQSLCLAGCVWFFIWNSKTKQKMNLWITTFGQCALIINRASGLVATRKSQGSSNSTKDIIYFTIIDTLRRRFTLTSVYIGAQYITVYTVGDHLLPLHAHVAPCGRVRCVASLCTRA